MIRRARSILVVVVMALSIAGCDYYTQAKEAADSGGPVPWFCDPVAPNSVTGPGMGTVDFYAGQSRQPLDHETCMGVARQFDQAKAYAKGYPTLGDAEAAGFLSTFGFIGGMGTHHGLGSLTPEMFADPNFDRDNPDMPAGSIIDDVFDPARPEFLQYNGNGPEAVLVGMSYYVRTDTGRPPEGFAGGNDWWHHHPTLCFNAATAQAFAAAISDSACSSRGGVNVRMDDYYMLHIWLVDRLEYHADVHAPMHPCITGSGAIFDMEDPCHDVWQGGGAATAGHAGHAAPATGAGAAGAPAGGAGAGTAVLAVGSTCPLGLAHDEAAPT